MHKEHHGFLYGVAAALTASGTALFVKLSAEATVSTIVFARFFVGFILMIGPIYYNKIEISWKKLPKNLVRSLGGIASIFTYFYAIQHIELVNAVTLSNTTPLFLPFVTFFWLKLIVSKLRMLAAAIGFVGVVILLRPTADFFVQWVSLVGLSSGLFGAIALMGVRQLSKTESTETILAYYFLIGAVVSCLFIPWNLKPIYEPMQWVYLLCSAICSFIYQIVITKAYTHAPATKVSSVGYLAVVFGGLFGWLFFAEVPDIWVLVGTLFIIGGALIALFDKTPSRRRGE